MAEGTGARTHNPQVVEAAEIFAAGRFELGRLLDKLVIGPVTGKTFVLVYFTIDLLGLL
jgi:hypothetical protein